MRTLFITRILKQSVKSNHLKNLSANTIQLVINQVFGLVIFYILSARLDKASFGQFNWVLAVLLTAFNILACGIDQLVIKKVARGDDAANVTSLFITHVLLSGLLFYTCLGFVWWLAPHNGPVLQLLMLIGAGKLALYFSTPFKQLASGKERFGLLAKMAVVSNIVRGIALLLLALFQHISLSITAIVFLAGDSLEFVVTLFLFYRYLRLPVVIKLIPKAYLKLLKEALPQIGVVLFTSALARFDWIFIGLYLSAVKLAEYSFAYKAFEISTLPLLAIAPLLLPRFVNLIKERGIFPPGLFQLLRIELAGAAFIGLMLYLCWSPLVDWLTGDKYGTVNSAIILVLAAGMPLMYFNNFLWSIGFAQGKMRLIFKVFAVTFVVNIIGDVMLIPLIGNIGAAIAYLAAMLAQAVLYSLSIEKQLARRAGIDLLICMVCSLVSGLITLYIFTNIWAVVFFAAAMYALLALLTGQINLKKLTAIKLAIG
ncbi:Membrane protein involved in the export of O-antigen and teichoic acid [Mucilaginibacter polytrichastri]|nr:Membrane protein involved in the export of O-antigen and teichoic acid [Mucilaginibacter polytrichastri]